MKFKIIAEKNANDEKVFFYDNTTNELFSDDGESFSRPKDGTGCSNGNCKSQKPFISFDEHHPLKKSRKVRIVKIQLGLSCNYACDYCSQKFVERPKETNPKDIELFMEMFSTLEFSEKDGLKIEFWGGEPLVYWKTLKPLAHAITDKFQHWKVKPRLSMITNGSLLTEDICAWLYAMDFSIAISHDGPGQAVRGPDPFDDPEKKETILGLYRVLKSLGRMSFNSMLNGNNLSRKKIYEWFVNLTGDPFVALGEGSIVDAYDEDGLASSLQTKTDHFNFRRTSFNDIYSTHGQIGFGGIVAKVDGFTDDVLSQKSSSGLGQKCGMDKEDVISFDLRGNVITCQNVSSLEKSPSGVSHFGGTIEKIEEVEIKTATHWSKRPDCSNCPVLHICQGSCMFLSGKYWEASCNNAYSDAIPLFALSFEKMTGYIPKFIDSEHLPDDRKDIWGTILTHSEVKKKVIPIHISKTPIATSEVNGVKVFQKKEEAVC